MSGSALNPLLLVKNTSEAALAFKLHCNSGSKSPSECLKIKSTRDIQAAVEESVKSINMNHEEDIFRSLSGHKSEYEDNQESTHPSLTLASFGPIVDGLVIPSDPSNLLRELDLSAQGNFNNTGRNIRSIVNESNVHTLLVNDSPTSVSPVGVSNVTGTTLSADQKAQEIPPYSAPLPLQLSKPPLPPQDLPQPPSGQRSSVISSPNESDQSTQVSLQIRFDSILALTEGQIESPINSFISTSIPSISLSSSTTPHLRKGPSIGTHDLLLGVNEVKSIHLASGVNYSGYDNEKLKISQWLQSLFPSHPIEVSV